MAPSESSTPRTLAQSAVDVLSARGVRRLFGIPGGGSSLDLMEAARVAGLDVVLARTETAAAIMAAVTGEITGVPGVCFTGIGPGAASAVNGVAYASLERAPLVLFTDARAPGPGISPHQVFDQGALFAPVTKDHARLRPEDGPARLAALLDTALAWPRGPVQVDLTSADSAAPAGPVPAVVPAAPMTEPDLDAARHLLARARRPVILAGLEARHDVAPAALGRLAETLACPVLCTYKAKGVFPDNHPQAMGLFTGAEAERPCLSAADLILFYGLDQIEMIPGRWDYSAPILALRRHGRSDGPLEPAALAVGGLADLADGLVAAAAKSDWTAAEIAGHRTAMARRLALGGDGATAAAVMAAARATAPAGCRLAVDAGAHMFSALAEWSADAPHGVLKSNGLSTMGYALPAAIAAALAEPETPVLAVSGDGGMMMCLAEVSTAARLGLPLVVAVVNDAALSLIDIKQQRQQRPALAVRYPAVDFATAAQAQGAAGWRVAADGDLEAAFAKAWETAAATGGPVLLDIACDPSGYGEQLMSLRG